MLKILIVDSDERRAEKLAEEYRRGNDCSAAVALPTGSIRRYLKRHNSNVLLLFHSVPVQKGLTFMAQAKQHNCYVVSVIENQARPTRMIDALSDLIFTVDEVMALGNSFVKILEDRVSKLKFEAAGRKGYRYHNLFADTDRGFIYFGDKRLPLTPTEYQILCLLIIHGGEIVDKKEIIRQIWGATSYSSRSLETHIRNLRKKLRAETKKYDIICHRSKGCQLKLIT